MKALAVASVIACVLVAPSAARGDGLYGLGVAAEYGNGYLPPTGQAGLSTTLRYHEHGGIIGGIVLLLGSVPVKPSDRTSTEYKTECSGTGSSRSCLEWTETTTTHPSEAELEQYNQAVASWKPEVGEALMRGELGQEVEMDIPLRALGGNASGFMFRLWRPVAGNRVITIGQYAIGWITFHDVKTRVVSATGSELQSMEKVSDVTYKYVGLPVRFRTPLGHTGVGLTVQFDLNALAIVMDQPSPIRAYLQWAGYHTMLSVGGMVSGFRPDGASLSAEAALAF